MNEYTFHIGPIRPPSEASSLLFQITRGCTWNKCRFCQLYKGTQFATFSADELKKDVDHMVLLADRIRKHQSASYGWDIPAINRELRQIVDPDEQQCYHMMASWLINDGSHVFLQDGNSTVLRDGRLSDVLHYLKDAFPQIDRITSYGRAENLSRLSVEEFAELKEAGLDRIHSGFETGSDLVLSYINKGVTQEQEIRAGQNIKAGGIELSIYFMPGVGGKPLTKSNAEETAYVLNAVNPDYFRIRTFTAKSGTDLYDDWKSGKHISCSDEEKLLEIRRVIELAKNVDTTIASDHIVNLLQNVEGHMIQEKAQLLLTIDDFLNLPEPEKKEFQLARRMGLVSAPTDMQLLGSARMTQLRSRMQSIPEERWEKEMNLLMERYV